VRREADGEPEPADGLDRQVVLAHVDGVGPDEDGQIGPIVDGERDAEPAGRLARLLEERQEPSVGEALLPHLDQVDAPADGGLEERR
jgi:hypothetical protein